MPHAKGVILAFRRLWKTADASIFPVGMKNITPACQDLVAISLVSNIPYDLVEWSIKNMVKGHCEFHHTQACTEMTWIGGNHLYNVLAQLFTELYQLIRFKGFHVSRTLYGFENCIVPGGALHHINFLVQRYELIGLLIS